MPALSKAEIAATHAALQASEGHRATAAASLGISPDTLKERIHNHPALRAAWSSRYKEFAPSNPETLARTSPIPSELIPEAPVLQHEQALAVAIQQEDLKFRGGLEGLGLSSLEMDLAVSLQNFHGKHFAKCVDLISAGLTVTALRVIKEIERTLKRMQAGFTGENALFEERMILNHFNKLCENLVIMTNAAANGAGIRAKIELWKKQAADAANKPTKPKPGFAPLKAIQVNAEQVNIS